MQITFDIRPVVLLRQLSYEVSRTIWPLLQHSDEITVLRAPIYLGAVKFLTDLFSGTRNLNQIIYSRDKSFQLGFLRLHVGLVPQSNNRRLFYTTEK